MTFYFIIHLKEGYLHVISNNKNKHLSPIYRFRILELDITTLVMLAKPFSPTSDKTISLIVLVKQFVTNLLSIPNLHIVVDLQSLRIKHYC